MQATPIKTIEPLAIENERLKAEVVRLELLVKELKGQLWGRSSERTVIDAGQRELFADPAAIASVAKPANAEVANAVVKKKSAVPKGPKPLDPNLPRVVIKVACPELKALMCPVTGKLMQPGFVETLEVLSRRPAVWFVKKFERTVYVSPAKDAPVYSPWPTDVLPRSRVDAGVVAFIAAEHFCEHQPYYRMEKHLERLGVDLPRVCQVSLMEQLNERVQPLVEQMKQVVLKSGYVHLDATPIDLCDPSRPGATRESTLWAYRAHDGPVFFEFQLSKSPTHPAKVLVDGKYKGLLQTDGATGFEKLGIQKLVTHLGCFAHLRRYFFKAEQAGELSASANLKVINRIFRIDRLARHFKLTEVHRSRLRMKHSHALFLALVAKAEIESVKIPPKTRTGEALHYLLAKRESLERCITTPGACLDNNAVERAIRPLKLGAKNWLQIGHPDAGPRLANLFTLVENCRQEGIDAEAYLADMITRLPDHPMARIAEMLPQQWKLTRAKARASAKATENAKVETPVAAEAAEEATDVVDEAVAVAIALAAETETSP